jgi:hypothetical protein
MVQDWERIGDLMVTAIRHWATFRPKMTMELFKAGTLGKRALEDCKATMEQIYSQKDKFDRMDVWDVIREDRILLPEESDFDSPTNEEAKECKKCKLHLGEAGGIADDALADAKMDWGWNPSKTQ